MKNQVYIDHWTPKKLPGLDRFELEAICSETDTLSIRLTTVLYYLVLYGGVYCHLVFICP